MPPRRNNPPRRSRGGASSQKPPKVMTWGKAIPVLAVALFFDAVRFMFEWFIFFGPAMAALFCTVAVGETVGTTIGGLVCTAGAVAAGTVASPAIIAFGVVMAMATGLIGWLVVGGLLMGINSRIFKENFLWFVGSLLISEIPIINSVPAITLVVWRMYSHQIKTEKAARNTFEKEQASIQAQERNQRIAEFMLTQTRVAQEQTVRDEQYAQEAADDEKHATEEIPEEERGAA